ncbi:hypothetical protein RRF57_004602 [Xylaria bambusicola]|uniref:Uncharacterized protein n=1 Tax=Xylaria bambusicola TaxID=326684 RepID=A0AAN7UI10_9PEZI
MAELWEKQTGFGLRIDRPGLVLRLGLEKGRKGLVVRSTDWQSGKLKAEKPLLMHPHPQMTALVARVETSGSTTAVPGY